ncbi:MAG: DUF3108 domain-containing protein [Gammaproteobacteria bacterium]|nr:DUF3108 domain-containing protein [Gammaproteobacteria bacterium]
MKRHSRLANIPERRGWSLLLLAVLSLSTAQARESLTPHTAEYKVKISVVSGRLNTELAATDAGYVATHVIVPTGLSRMLARGEISEASEFSNTGDGILPFAYRSNDTISGDNERSEIEFDWDSGKASGTVNGENYQSDLDALSHDRVSIQYALMHDLLNDTPSSSYRLFEVDKRKTLNVRSIGTREVKVPAGTFSAVGIQHQARNSSRVTTLWCVEELDYLPVIIEQHRNGKLRVRATLRRYTPVG